MRLGLGKLSDGGHCVCHSSRHCLLLDRRQLVGQVLDLRLELLDNLFHDVQAPLFSPS